MPHHYDAIIIGAAHNGLTCACHLARAGLKVLVLEQLGQGAFVPYQSGSQRPIPDLGQYKTPVPNVYLCSSGSHPGPGVSMAPGRNAAQVIFRDLGFGFYTRDLKLLKTYPLDSL